LTDTSLYIYICVLNTSGWQTLNSVSSPDIRNISSISAKVCAFLYPDVVKLFVRVPYTGIRTFVIVAASEHGKLEY